LNFCDLMGNEQFAFNASVFILLLGAAVLIWYIKKILPIYFNIRRMVTKLKEADGEKGFRANYDKLNKIFLDNEVLGHSWYEFSEGLLIGEKKIKNTKRSIEYFSRDTLIYGHLNLPFYQSMPNILTGLGILGTFGGLLCGVSQVDIKEINSIELLLHGASFSFYTSIAGLIASILFTLCKKSSLFLIDFQIQQWVEMLDQRLEWLSLEKIAYLSLKNQKQQVHIFENLADRLGAKLNDSLENILKTEIDLLTQIKNNTEPAYWESIDNRLHKIDTHSISMIDKIVQHLDDIKTEMGDQLINNNKTIVESIKHIAQGFDEFKDTMVQENTNSVVEALEVVIKDFNQKVNEQFGKNFIEYNEAVHNLLEWQGIHKDHVDKMHVFITDYLDNVKSTSQMIETAQKTLEAMNLQLTDMVGNVSDLSMSSRDIDHTLIALNKQNVKMEAFIQSIKEMGDSARESIPEIGKNIDKCANDMSKSAEHFKTQISNLTSGLSEVQDKFSANASKMSEKIELMMNGVSSEITSNANVIANATGKAATQIQAASEEHTKQIDSTTKQINSTLASLLADSFKSLSNNLSKISQVFISELSEEMSGIQKHFSSHTSEMSENIESMTKKVNDQITTNSDAISQNTEKATAYMERISEEHSKQIDKTTEQIESGLETLLNESLKSLAGSLIALSNKFVEDYSPLTDKLQSVVRIAASIDDITKIKRSHIIDKLNDEGKKTFTKETSVDKTTNKQSLEMKKRKSPEPPIKTN